MNIKNNNQNSNIEEVGFDSARLIAYLWRYWYLLILFPILGMLTAFLYKRYQIPQYSISSTILIRAKNNENKQQVSPQFDLNALFSNSASQISDEIEIMKSRTMMLEAIKQLKFNPVVNSLGRIKKTSYYNEAMPIEIDSFSIKGEITKMTLMLKITSPQNYVLTYDKNKKVQGVFGSFIYLDSTVMLIRCNPALIKDQTEFSIDLYDPNYLADMYLSRLSVDAIKARGGGMTNAVSLKVEDAIPAKGIDLLNKLIEIYNLQGIDDKNQRDKAALSFISDRLDVLISELSNVEKDIEGFKTKQGITADVTTDLNYLFNQLGISEQKLTEYEVKKSVLQMLLESFNKQDTKSQFAMMPTNVVDNNNLLAMQIEGYNKLIFEREKLLKQVSENHPSIIVLEKQIIDYKNNIRKDIYSSIKNLEQETNVYVDKLRNQNSVISKKLNSTPQKERELLEISRSKNIKESLYIYLLQKREETALALASTIPNAKILDAPASTALPIKPSWSKVIGLALLLGISMPVIFFASKLYLDDSIEKEDDIRTNSSVPYIGFLAHNKTQKYIVLEKGSRSALAETFRLLRANIQFMLATSKNKVIMLTSSMSGEGKSFVSLNLGMSLALSGKKTIVLGFDLRKPKLDRYIGSHTIKNKYGITNFLAGSVGVADIISQSTLCPDMYFAVSGPVPPNPAELIMQERTDELFSYLNKNFDYIIIDTPPIGLVVDALLLNKYVGTVLYVTRANVTTKKQLHIINSLVNEGKLHNPSIVLNDVKFGRGYGYGYGYGYGTYTEEKKKGYLSLFLKYLKKKINIKQND